MTFSKFKEMWNHDHNLVLDRFRHLQKISQAQLQSIDF